MNTPIGEAAFIASTVARLFADLRALVGLDPAPVTPAPERHYRLREHQRNAVAKAGVVGAGAVIYEGICANA